MKTRTLAGGALIAITCGVLFCHTSHAQPNSSTPTAHHVQQGKSSPPGELNPDRLAGFNVEICTANDNSTTPAQQSYLVRTKLLMKSNSSDHTSTITVPYLLVKKGGDSSAHFETLDNEKLDVTINAPDNLTRNPMTIHIERKTHSTPPTQTPTNEMTGVEFKIKEIPDSSLQYDITTNLLKKPPSGDTTPTTGPHFIVEQGQNASFHVTGKDGTELNEEISIAPNPPSLSMTIHMEQK